ncbi:hypothetical protein HK414_23465 [Ramlibacter terrae]|uniref:Uncharacterized protein n=1 Tax=Ramlibacter terrae TaxID=2732511 RepID=A0ABX6P7D3_9BURK|nr:hypothetical protein HK414_23465 [Ramlibacter terrae]
MSLGFGLLFFVPLLVVALGFLVYCGFAQRSVVPAARRLSILWVVASVPAALLIVMGHAFNSSKMNPILVIPIWILIGLAALWFPVMLRAVFRIRPV